MIIRNEKESDYDAITEITLEAFVNEPHSNQTEPFIIKALRAANALTVSLVAQNDVRRLANNRILHPVSHDQDKRLVTRFS